MVEQPRVEAFAAALQRTGYPHAAAKGVPGWARDLLAEVDLGPSEPMHRGLIGVSDMTGENWANHVLMIATDHRVLLLRVTGVLRSNISVAEMQYALLQPPTASSGWRFGSIAISGIGGGQRIAIDHVDKDAIREMAAFLQAQVAAAAAAQPAPQAPTRGLSDELERIADLRERGHLSEAEFQEAKRRLLA